MGWDRSGAEQGGRTRERGIGRVLFGSGGPRGGRECPPSAAGGSDGKSAVLNRVRESRAALKGQAPVAKATLSRLVTPTEAPPGIQSVQGGDAQRKPRRHFQDPLHPNLPRTAHSTDGGLLSRERQREATGAKLFSNSTILTFVASSIVS